LWYLSVWIRFYMVMAASLSGRRRSCFEACIDASRFLNDLDARGE
jgi:hypothetical protein